MYTSLFKNAKYFCLPLPFSVVIKHPLWLNDMKRFTKKPRLILSLSFKKISVFGKTLIYKKQRICKNQHYLTYSQPDGQTQNWTDGRTDNVAEMVKSLCRKGRQNKLLVDVCRSSKILWSVGFYTSSSHNNRRTERVT